MYNYACTYVVTGVGSAGFPRVRGMVLEAESRKFPVCHSVRLTHSQYLWQSTRYGSIHTGLSPSPSELVCRWHLLVLGLRPAYTTQLVTESHVTTVYGYDGVPRQQVACHKQHFYLVSRAPSYAAGL